MIAFIQFQNAMALLFVAAVAGLAYGALIYRETKR